ncbi:Glyoxylase, beta-lactamase superfamily II [Raineyella antarctica]|uniref:Glyoxylase, beta-lactamase superfamily II n=1 Tax=Raineyella antarctica TaxID=1577474 RepID=A0A1G6HPV9_9ACTN|nr:N-acyl homoserine lactonase family protein [Raineyella antarctica]SDB96319.1 Glyoxylase, beta-lactamase superfamily II [Raineyella antarctica]
MTSPSTPAAGDTRLWEAYAIQFARRQKSSREEHFYRGHDVAREPYPIAYYLWLLKSGDDAIVVDAGFTEETARKRGNRDWIATPTDTLRALGVHPERVGDLVLTHLHYDHTGYTGAFPAARVHVQDTELAYWSGPYGRRGENPHLVEADDQALVAALADRGRVEVHRGDAEIRPGVAVHLTGGHTQGLQVVAAATAAGTLVLTSDASHFYDNIRADRPYSIVDCLRDMYDGFDWINAAASSEDLVVPGHDPLVMERFPAVEGLEGIAVRLA